MKALVGSWDHRPYRLLSENAALRARVGELELELRRTREENDLLASRVSESGDVDLSSADLEVALTR
jgi:hypothetical protein